MGIFKSIKEFFFRRKPKPKAMVEDYPPSIAQNVPLEKKPPVKHISFHRNNMLAKDNSKPKIPKVLKKTTKFYGPDGKLQAE